MGIYWLFRVCNLGIFRLLYIFVLELIFFFGCIFYEMLFSVVVGVERGCN